MHNCVENVYVEDGAASNDVRVPANNIMQHKRRMLFVMMLYCVQTK